MANQLMTAYMRKLQSLCCGELQLLAFLGDVAEQVSDFKFGSSVHGLQRLCGERKDSLEMMAADHGFVGMEDDGDGMSRLVTEGRHELRHCARGRSRDVVIADICTPLHHFLLRNYRLARELAGRLGLDEDAARLADLMDLVEERFPPALDRPVRRTAFARPALAV
ncbi:DUF892 family protein [Luteolibacter marinus]|uniref:DUF892 family protein n=1 Tax=Luteolibacter marinus TaxID=2776705 RepID=UPI0018679F64|nr:DUF892 family protein [Luteolibacter marinus]